MRTKYFLTLKVALFLIVFCGVGRFCHLQTRGFQLHKILSTHHADPMPVLPSPSEEEKEELRAIFAQPFYFLGSGGQCYAFISQDQKTVLKFFKKHHIRLWEFFHRIPLPSALDGYRQWILRKNTHQSPALFESCKISYLELRERTGLIYLHLHQTDYFKQRLTIVDKLGIAHQIDMDAIDFALQKKAEFTNPKLKKLMRENQIDEAKACIDSMLDLIVERCRKGIRDRDPNFRRNMGFIGSSAIEIDLGSYSKDDLLLTPEGFKEELLDKTRKLKQWIGRRNPSLASYLSEKIDQVLKDREQLSASPDFTI
jgi:hypothetical protein